MIEVEQEMKYQCPRCLSEELYNLYDNETEEETQEGVQCEGCDFKFVIVHKVEKIFHGYFELVLANVKDECDALLQ